MGEGVLGNDLFLILNLLNDWSMGNLINLQNISYVWLPSCGDCGKIYL